METTPTLPPAVPIPLIRHRFACSWFRCAAMWRQSAAEMHFEDLRNRSLREASRCWRWCIDIHLSTGGAL